MANKRGRSITIEAKSLMVKQAMPLAAKINLSIQRIRSWYDAHEGNVCRAFSGGKDSTVLLHLVRSLYPHVPGVFVDTGLEYPEIRAFVKTIDNIIWKKPKITFKKVIETYGYPVISKAQAQYIYEYRHGSEKVKKSRWNGWNGTKRFKIAEKWKYLVDAPFEISDKCCKYLKKNPSMEYLKETGATEYVGLMASDSNARRIDYLKFGCNAFKSGRAQSRPLMFWKTQDIWDYIRLYNIPYSNIYDMGYKNTGCIFCGFGAHMNNPNRFQLMAKTHPKLWKYCMDKLGLREVLTYCKIPVDPDSSVQKEKNPQYI